MNRSIGRARAISMWFSALLVAGCSSLPSQPTRLNSSVTPSFVRVPKPATTPFSAGGDSVSSSSSKRIDGEKGGTITNGRFSLIIPRGAFKGKATISINVPDPSVMHCELSISPSGANGFAVPVQLVADCSNGDNVDVTSLQTLWNDTWNQAWVVVPGSTVSTSTSTISTPLMHFSEYGIDDGKAGW